jgi:hypothetical protein
MRLLSAAALVAVSGLSFTSRMNFPAPCNKRAGSGSAANAATIFNLFAKLSHRDLLVTHKISPPEVERQTSRYA